MGTVGVKPLAIDLVLSLHKKGEFHIEVYSTSPKEDTPVHLSLFDAVQTENGTMNFVEVGKNPYSCSTWIRLEKTDFTVPQGETVIIKGEVLAPATSSGSRLATIMVEPGYDKKAKGISIKIRYAVVLRLKINGRTIIENAKLEKVGIKKLSDGTPALEALIQNTSDIDFIANGRAIIQDSSGKILTSFDLTTESLEQKKRGKEEKKTRYQRDKKGSEEDKGQRLYAGAKVAFFGKIDKPIPPGEYTAIVDMKYGRKSLVSRQKITLTKDMVASLSKGSSHNASFEVKPADLEIKGQPGGMRTAIFTITNITEEPIKIALSVKDLEYGPDGEPVIKDKGTTPSSSSDWVVLGETEYTIGPRLSQSVPVKLSVPASAQPGGRYSLIVVEKSVGDAAAGQSTPTDKSAQAADKSTPSTQTEMSLVEVTTIIPGEVKPAAEISKFEQVKNKGGNSAFTLDVKNTSAIHLVPKGRIIVKDIYNHDVEQPELKLAARAVLPQTVGRMTATIGRKLIPGEYVAIAEIDYGGQEKAISKITFTVTAQK
jgi:hypothetical protein